MALDSLSEFDGREFLSSDEAPAEQAGNEQDDPQAGDPVETGDAGDSEGGRGPVPYNRYEETTQRLRDLEARNDELMRMLLADRRPQAQPEEEETDPDVERSVAPILNKRLRDVDKLLERERRTEQMTQLEELSPGIGKLWPKIQEEFKKLPPHLQPDFDGPAGAVALRARIEARPKNGTGAAGDLKNRSHTEASPGSNTRGKAQLSAQDINKMSRAEFDAFVETMRGRGARTGSDGYDPLLR